MNREQGEREKVRESWNYELQRLRDEDRHAVSYRHGRDMNIAISQQRKKCDELELALCRPDTASVTFGLSLTRG